MIVRSDYKDNIQVHKFVKLSTGKKVELDLHREVEGFTCEDTSPIFMLPDPPYTEITHAGPVEGTVYIYNPTSVEHEEIKNIIQMELGVDEFELDLSEVEFDGQ